MQKGVFSTWVKELCALVFVQTIQAFVLAIVLSIILTFLYPDMDESGVATVTSQDSVSALGVLCIVLLTSLTKMEQIVKKIFGLESGFMQNRPPHGLMTSFLALKAASRALNNLPKIASGVGNVIGGGFDRKKAKNANLTRLSRAGLAGNGAGTGISTAANGGSDNILPSEQDNLLPQDRQGNNESDESHRRRSDAIRNQLNENARNVAAQNAISAKSKPKDASKDYWKIMDKYDDELSKAKARQREGVKNILSGFAETGGALGGALGGAAVGLTSGLATGDLDQIPKAIGMGVGIGDKIGESTVNAGDAVSKGIKSIKSNIKTTSNLNANLTQMEKNLQIQKNSKKRATARFKDVQKAIKENNSINDL